jgi:hypothetical protein
MKIIFLDIDGVLNTHSTPGTDSGISVVLAYNLIDCINITKANIVISSAWRYMGVGYNSVLQQCIRGALDQDNAKVLCKSIIGATDLDFPNELRSQQILRWVKNNLTSTDMWCAVDDLGDNQMIDLGDRWIRVDPYIGFDRIILDKVISTLNN